MALSVEQEVQRRKEACTRVGRTITHCVPVEKIISLRHRILRQGLPIESASFEADNNGMTYHLATFRAGKDNDSVGEPLCCASFMWGEYKSKPAWQLRGMATDTPFQSLGLGHRLLLWFEEAIIDRGSRRLMWCNARVTAVKFYEANGWVCDSDEFDIPTAGPHRKMFKEV